MSPPDWSVAALLAASVAIGCAGTWALARELRRRAILDHPNARSSHAAPTPRGGGIAIVAALALTGGAALGLGYLDVDSGWVLGGVIVLAVLSFVDDVRTLSARARLLGQVAVVMTGLWLFHDSGSGSWLVLDGLLPSWLDGIVAGLAWLWFLNLFNFMDGIDGISGVETVTIGIGLAAIWLLVPLAPGFAPTVVLTGLAAAATAGFLVWNWHPARIFMGDVGSVPLGFLLGWALLDLAATGAWAAAAILPLYYLADATLTLLRRMARGEPVWRAHRSHAYQRATQRGLDHAQVSRRIALFNAPLVGLAVIAAFLEVWGALAMLLGAVPLTLAFLRYLGGSSRPADPSWK